MRPERDDIAVPPFPPDVQWIGPEPSPVERLTARGPALVHFFEAGEPSGVRTLPYLRVWHERYRERGLTVLGVHSPRSPLAATPERLAAAVERLAIPYPVAHDADHRVWRDYGCRGWPSLFLWGRGGALRWFHFGEGEYRATEAEIARLLSDVDADLTLPEPLEPLRPSDVPGARVIPPSEELLPGGSLAEPWSPSTEDQELIVDYAAGEVHAALDGEGAIEVRVDGADPHQVEVTAPGLYALAEHPVHEAHELRLRPEPGVRVWSVSFGAGVPG